MRAKRITNCLMVGFWMAMLLIGCDSSGGGTSKVDKPDVTFLSAPRFSVDFGFKDEPVETVVSIGLAGTSGIPAQGVKLVSADGTSPGELAILHDDGDVTNGDDIAGDGVYSARLQISKSEIGEYAYRVAVDAGIVRYSEPAIFTVLNRLSEQEIRYPNEKAIEAFQKHFPAAGSTFDAPQFEEYKGKVLAEIQALPEVIDASISADGNSIVAKFQSGMNLSIDFVYAIDGTGLVTQGGRRGSAAPKTSAMKQAPIDYYLLGDSKDSVSKSTSLPDIAAASAQEDSSVGSFRAMALSPFQWRFAPWEANHAYQVIQNSSYPDFAAEPPVVDADVTVERFKKLSSYGIIFINSHGTLDGTTPLVSTGEEATWDRQSFYQAELTANRVLVSQMVNISLMGDGRLRFDNMEARQFFKIAPAFITKYNKNLPNSLVYLGICNGLASNSLADAFIAAGAAVVVGFNDTVTTGYNYAVAGDFLSEMVKGKPVREAIEIARAQNGNSAVLAFRGNGDIVLELAGIRNGGFEEELKFWWQNGGDVRVISKLASLVPREGAYMAIISSGLGAIVDSEAVITQEIKIPAGATTLSFDYNVVSEEPMEYYNSEYDDKFLAVLVDAEGNEYTLAYENVNDSTWLSIKGDQADGGIFDEGDETAFHTGWKKTTYDVSSLAGKTVTLKFMVWDVGDSEWDTAALLDNIKLQ